MPELRVWLYFVVVFTIAVGGLMIGAAIHEYWHWKRGK